MGIFDLNKVAKEFEEPMKEFNDQSKKIYKYYLEVIGGSKELYTVKANSIRIDSYGCYAFILNDEVIASYPIARTIVKSIEEKTNEQA